MVPPEERQGVNMYPAHDILPYRLNFERKLEGRVAFVLLCSYSGADS